MYFMSLVFEKIWQCLFSVILSPLLFILLSISVLFSAEVGFSQHYVQAQGLAPPFLYFFSLFFSLSRCGISPYFTIFFAYFCILICRSRVFATYVWAERSSLPLQAPPYLTLCVTVHRHA
ncbi:hypothetical protein KP509_01G044600 [Ceratopteris richardii]|uniref:Uncharacterized protein n=1 Tax=Ceratopteris richardii TaxID=49495 RepID=A0A8T2VG51_CERRI|nr:hypothetical protein KP509_01G044600 [Ceratopteris richardii]